MGASAANGAGVASKQQERGRLHPRNKLNDLTGKEWIRFTRSWFVLNPPPRSASQVEHPAKYPEELAGPFIEFFTKKGGVVLDPFMGVGSTLLACSQTGRRGVGIELNPKYFELACQHLGAYLGDHHLFNDDAGQVSELFARENLPLADLVLTSPPYWDMLAHSRGNVFSTHKRRQADGLDTVYSEDARDLGNFADYDEFLQRLTDLFRKVAAVVRPRGHLVVVLQNLRSPEGRMVPLAWDLARELDRFLVFKGERVWCQDNKRLGIWGYPSEFVSNVHHHYCLIFRKAD